MDIIFSPMSMIYLWIHYSYYLCQHE